MVWISKIDRVKDKAIRSLTYWYRVQESTTASPAHMVFLDVGTSVTPPSRRVLTQPLTLWVRGTWHPYVQLSQNLPNLSKNRNKCISSQMSSIGSLVSPKTFLLTKITRYIFYREYLIYWAKNPKIGQNSLFFIENLTYLSTY